MKLLHRYFLKNNLSILFVCLAIGIGVYLLADLFDRLDDFIEAGCSSAKILTYFGVKIPLIISQILPAVYLVSVLLLLSLMARSNEIIALQSGGISFGKIIRFFVVYSLIWSFLQLGFSQYLGVWGEERAGRIWKEDVRKTQMDRRILQNVWFNDGRYVVKLENVMPAQQHGWGITVYVLKDDKLEWKRIIRATYFRAEKDDWLLRNVSVLSPEGFVYEHLQQLRVDIKRNIKAFVAMDPHKDPSQLPLWQLGDVISTLKSSGSNVEALRTVWHQKVSYAFSLLVMGLIALALVSLWDNIYLNMVLGMVLSFAYYGVTIVCVSAGEKGFLHPFFAAWAGNFFFMALASGRLIWVILPRQGHHASKKIQKAQDNPSSGKPRGIPGFDLLRHYAIWKNALGGSKKKDSRPSDK